MTHVDKDTDEVGETSWAFIWNQNVPMTFYACSSKAKGSDSYQSLSLLFRPPPPKGYVVPFHSFFNFLSTL